MGEPAMTVTAAPMRLLGVLGGMGPGATADVLTKIIECTPALRDQDHIPVLVRCVPQIPDRSEALLGGGPSPEAALRRGAAALRRSGVEVLAIACNTAHHWYEAVRSAAGPRVETLHIADAVAAAALERLPAGGAVGVLATRGALASAFHQRRLLAAGLRPLVPSAEAQADYVDRAIALAKAGDWAEAGRAARSAVEAMRAQGADLILLACTELPLALRGAGFAPDLIDSNLALARACVRAASADRAIGDRRRRD